MSADSPLTSNNRVDVAPRKKRSPPLLHFALRYEFSTGDGGGLDADREAPHHVGLVLTGTAGVH
jgi:hypothetical protein